MLANVSDGSYSDEFRRRRMSEKLAGGGRPNLLTDRQTYITYLETQLDQVTAACMAVQAFNDRIQQVQNQSTCNESRLHSMVQELHLESGERDRHVQKLESLDRQIQERMKAVEERCQGLESQIKSVVNPHNIEAQIHRIITTKLNSILSDNQHVEQKLVKLLNQSVDTLRQSQSDCERRLVSIVQDDKDYLESAIRNVQNQAVLARDHRLEKFQDRIEAMKQDIIRDLGQQMGALEVHKIRELQSRRMVQLQQEAMNLINDVVTASGRDDLSERLDEQARHAGSATPAAAIRRLDSAESQESRGIDRDRAIESIEGRVRTAEQICSRIAHDTLRKVDLHRQESLEHLQEMYGGMRDDSFRIEMRNEQRRWESTMSTLIQNTETQIKRLADSMMASKAALTCALKAVTDDRHALWSDASSAVDRQLLSERVYEKQHQPWMNFLAKWRRRDSPPHQPDSTGSYASERTSIESCYSIATDGDHLDQCDSNLGDIADTVHQLDRESRREAAGNIAPTKQCSSSSKQRATRRPKKSIEPISAPPKVLTISRKKQQQFGLSLKAIKR